MLAALAGTPRRGADPSGLYETCPRQRVDGHPPRGPPPPPRGRQHPVSRGLVEGEARAQRVRPPVRAPHVHRLQPRRERRVRPSARGRGRREQREHGNGGHGLLRAAAVERPRAAALPRRGPDGDARRVDHAGEVRDPAVGRREREARRDRQPAVRHDAKRRSSRTCFLRGIRTIFPSSGR